MPKVKRKSSEAHSEAPSSTRKKSGKRSDLVAAVYKQYGHGANSAVKTQLSEQPKQSFRYTGLTVKREWPIRTQVTQKIAPVGATARIGANSSLHYSLIVPANQFWR